VDYTLGAKRFQGYISRLPDGKIYFHVSGKVEASTEPFDMRLQRMLGHIPALLHPEPKSVLIVGFGAGVTAGSFVVHPKMERIQICEIEPLIPQVVSAYFQKENYNVLKDPRVQIVYDDARNFQSSIPVGVCAGPWRRDHYRDGLVRPGACCGHRMAIRFAHAGSGDMVVPARVCGALHGETAVVMEKRVMTRFPVQPLRLALFKTRASSTARSPPSP
jgi:hypothetical protein